MIIKSHNGKTMRVSEKRFNEYSKKEENCEDWLQFRMRVFGFSREELIMHPEMRVIFLDSGVLKEVVLFRGRFHGGFYLTGRLDEYLFDTPEEAYKFAMNLKGGQS